MSARRVEFEEWEPIAQISHMDCFGDEFLDYAKKFDYVVLVEDGDIRLGYSTVKELDSESAYLVFGGVFSHWRNKKVGVFKEIVEFLKPKYKRIGFATKTKNFPMIKLGINENFELVGMKKFNKIPYGEFLLEV